MKLIAETQGGPSARAGYVTKQEIAKHFGRTGRTIETWMRIGILPYFKVGRSVFFRLDDVERHFEQHFHFVRRPTAAHRRRISPEPALTTVWGKQARGSASNHTRSPRPYGGNRAQRFDGFGRYAGLTEAGGQI